MSRDQAWNVRTTVVGRGDSSFAPAEALLRVVWVEKQQPFRFPGDKESRDRHRHRHRMRQGQKQGETGEREGEREIANP